MHFVGRIRTKLDNEPFNQTRSYPNVAGIYSLPFSGLSKNLLYKLYLVLISFAQQPCEIAIWRVG